VQREQDLCRGRWTPRTRSGLGLGDSGQRERCSNLACLFCSAPRYTLPTRPASAQRELEKATRYLHGPDHPLESQR